MLGPPDTVVELGETEVSEEIFMDYLSSLGESTYRSSSCYPSLLHAMSSPFLIQEMYRRSCLYIEYNVPKQTRTC